MTKGNQPDEFDAMRTVVAALEKFDAGHQQRILRYVQEKLGIPDAESRPATFASANPAAPAAPKPSPAAAALAAAPPAPGTQPDIKSFIEKKDPKSDVQFAAAVAYFYQFEAAPGARKDSITTEDLQDACRKANRSRFQRPAQTFGNAHSQGLLDKGNERGTYKLSTVGENLVAVAMPTDGNPARVKSSRKKPVARKKSAKRR